MAVKGLGRRVLMPPPEEERAGGAAAELGLHVLEGPEALWDPQESKP